MMFNRYNLMISIRCYYLDSKDVPPVKNNAYNTCEHLMKAGGALVCRCMKTCELGVKCNKQ